MFLKSFFSIRSDRKYRLGSILGAVGLALIGIFLGFSITTSLFDLPFFFPAPGDFFVAAYGILAFMIPAYLIAAALILLDAAYRPDRIFILSAMIFPFMTLAIGFAIFRDYNSHAERFRFMALLGKTGFSFGILLLTFLEVAVIRALAVLLFPLRSKSPAGGKAAGFNRTFPLLGPPKPKTRRAYAETASEEDEADKDESPSGAIRQQEPQTRTSHTGAVKPSTWYDSSPVLSQEDRGPPDTYKPGTFKALEIRRISAAGLSGLLDRKTLRLEYHDRERETRTAEIKVPAEIAAEIVPRELEDSAEIGESAGTEEFVGMEVSTNSLEEALERAEVFPGNEDFPDTGDPDIDPGEAGGIPAGEEDFDFPEDEEERGNEESVPLPPSAAPAVAAAVHPAVISLPAAVEAGVPVPRQEASLEGSPAREKKPGARKAAQFKPYRIPVDGILNQYPDGQYWIIDQPTRDAANVLQKTLEEFGIQAEVTGIRKGPVITMFEILPAPGVKLSKIVNLQDNIALRLAASSVRIVAPIPGKHAVGIEVPNRKRNIVSFREIIDGEQKNDAARAGKKDIRGPEIPVVLGKDITGEAQTMDLVQMPHLLIAGATGSGKSVCVNTLILSILYQRAPAECRLLLIDPKIVELKLYNDIPHLLTPVITEPKRAFQALQYCLFEMERRYACLDSMGVRDIKTYNRRIRERNIAAEHMPYIVVVIDEFADLMVTTGKELESTVARLAAMSRAVGIHLVLATQRPSIDVITGLIKANIPSRIAFMVASKMDSRIIIDMVGAEKLLGKGDMLYAGVVDPFPIRMQGAFVSEEEVERVVDYVKTLGQPDYIDDEIFFDDDEDDAPPLFAEGEDPLYDKALEIVVQQGKASASYIQRRLKIGYNRAARLVEEMEIHGVVGPAQGSKPRELLRGV
ncbi:MAG: DNA translocase FtsK [Treponema sp.]|nr:DNA translocase FtsK [Treponema sp.]